MAPLAGKILSEISKRPGITDRRLAEAIFGSGAPQQRVNGGCRALAQKGLLVRRKRDDGLIGNYIGKEPVYERAAPGKPQAPETKAFMSEDQLKTFLKAWLEADGWSVEVAWGKSRGVDLIASRGGEEWLIEAKGEGSRSAMRVNYFLGMLGELLQRMSDPNVRYSIACPDIGQFRNLWSRLPDLAKERTQITALFVNRKGKIDLVS